MAGAVGEDSRGENVPRFLHQLAGKVARLPQQSTPPRDFSQLGRVILHQDLTRGWSRYIVGRLVAPVIEPSECQAFRDRLYPLGVVDLASQHESEAADATLPRHERDGRTELPQAIGGNTVPRAGPDQGDPSGPPRWIDDAGEEQLVRFSLELSRRPRPGDLATGCQVQITRIAEVVGLAHRNNEQLGVDFRGACRRASNLG